MSKRKYPILDKLWRIANSDFFPKEPVPVKHQVRSLHDIVLDFVAENAFEIQSLVNFPSIVGQRLFQRCIDIGPLRTRIEGYSFNSFMYDRDMERKTKLLNIFIEAYPDEVLNSVELSDSLIFINEYLSHLPLLMTYIKSLDLTGCRLGANHKMIEQIGHLTLLENLSLRQNCLSNLAICVITHQLHYHSRGPAHLKHLDLSNNPSLNDDMISCLSEFKELYYLNLTVTNITDDGRQMLKERCNLFPCDMVQFKQKPIITVGWARMLIHQWSDIYTYLEMRRIKRQFPWDDSKNKRYGCCCSSFLHMMEMPIMHIRFARNFIFKRIKNMPPEELSKLRHSQDFLMGGLNGNSSKDITFSM